MRRFLGALMIGALLLSGASWFTPAPAEAGCYGSTYVSGYYTARGTYVSGYYRTCPNSTVYDNYSYRGNYNPYSGSYGTRSYDSYSYSSPSSSYRSYDYSPRSYSYSSPSYSSRGYDSYGSRSSYGW